MEPPFKRTRSMHACDRCARLKKKCSGQQPCEKCLRSDVANKCVFSPQSYGLPKIVPAQGASQSLPPLSTITESLPPLKRPRSDRVETFLTSFHEHPEMDEEYFPSPFHADAQLVMGERTFFGHGAILRSESSDAWKGIRRRRYFVDGKYDEVSDIAQLKVPDIPLNFDTARRMLPSAEEHVLHGKVDLEADDGSVLEGLNWAGKMVVCPRNQKIVSYQVYIDRP